MWIIQSDKKKKANVPTEQEGLLGRGGHESFSEFTKQGEGMVLTVLGRLSGRTFWKVCQGEPDPGDGVTR